MANKLPNVEYSLSPRIISKSQTPFNVTLFGFSQKIIKQPTQNLSKRKSSLSKQQQSLKKQLTYNNLVQIQHNLNEKKSSQNILLTQNTVNKSDDPLLIQERKYNELLEKYNLLKQQFEQDHLYIEELIRKLNYLKEENNDLNQQINNNKTHLSCYQQIQEYKTKLIVQEIELTNISEQNYKNKKYINSIENKFHQLFDHLKTLKSQLLCQYCHKKLKNAITIIPCAHNYCQQCFQGYFQQCFVCKDEIKIQATYHNDYINDLENIQQWLEQSMIILNS